MTIDTDKLKALALAARDQGAWPFHETAFRKASSPATVLELIAEVERLRADAAARPQIDERYEFERHMSQRGDAANYIGDGMYHSGAVQDQWEAWLARAAIEAHTKAGSRPCGS